MVSPVLIFLSLIVMMKYALLFVRVTSTASVFLAVKLSPWSLNRSPTTLIAVSSRYLQGLFDAFCYDDESNIVPIVRID